MIRTKCGVGDCGKMFDDWKVYAEHILKCHKADRERVQWAEHALADVDKKEVELCI